MLRNLDAMDIAAKPLKVLNEVLSLNAQELVHTSSLPSASISSMKS